MDFSFHLQQGQHLLQNQDAASMKKALQHFKSANELTDTNHPGKPRTLYYLAVGNLMIGNLVQSVKLAHRAKQSIDFAVDNSIIKSDNLRQMLGETDIDDLIHHLNSNYFHAIFNIDVNEYFNENALDFQHVEKIYPTVQNDVVHSNFSIHKDLLMATFAGMARTNDELVYFDKKNGDVLSFVEGYFSSLLGDQSISNRALANKITSGAPRDYIDENRYILIDRLQLVDFISEYIKQANGLEPFSSYPEYFSQELLKQFSYDKRITINDLGFSNHFQNKFHELFSEKFNGRYDLRESYTDIFEKTCDSISLRWIKENVFN